MRSRQRETRAGGGGGRSTQRRLGKQTSKKKGEMAEVEFLRRAVWMGFRVSKPYGDSDRYDFVVDTGTRLVRVQVKSSSRLSQGAYFIASQRCSNGVAIPYRVDEIDFLAAYVFPEDAWFIIPVEAFVPRTSLHLFPRERGEVGIFARYREAWRLLKGGGQVESPSWGCRSVEDPRAWENQGR